MTLRILVANDDGIYSPGLRTLADVARRFGQVRIVAPDVKRLTWEPSPQDVSSEPQQAC